VPAAASKWKSTDDGPGAAPASCDDGGGLTGMRERAAVLGGAFEAGPAPRGGFRGVGVAAGGVPVIRVVIADDQAMIRAGLRVLLSAEPGIEVVGEAAGRAGRGCRRSSPAGPTSP
jgi:hypothetical protein